MISIYKITHKESGKAYIGQAVDVKRRWKEHCAPSSKCRKLSRAIQKYGKEAFNFEIVLEVSPEEADHYETLIIALNNSVEDGYNICHEGGSRRGSKCSDETRKKIANAKKNISDETRKRLSEAKKGELNNNSKLSNAQRDEIIALYATGEYSQAKLGRMFGVAQNTICTILINIQLL